MNSTNLAGYTYKSIEDGSFYDRDYYFGLKKSNYTNYLAERDPNKRPCADKLFDYFDLKGKRVLDVGCGFGWDVEGLLLKGVDCYGIDIAICLDSFVPEELKDRIKRGTGVNLPFDDNSFYLVYSLSTMEHIPEYNIKKYIDEMLRVSSDYMLFTTLFTIENIGDNTYYDYDKSHVSCFSFEHWEKCILKDYRYKIWEDFVPGARGSQYAFILRKDEQNRTV